MRVDRVYLLVHILHQLMPLSGARTELRVIFEPQFTKPKF